MLAIASVISQSRAPVDKLCPWLIRRMLPFHSDDGTRIGELHRSCLGMERSSFFRVREPKVNLRSKRLRFQRGPDWSTVFEKEICISTVTTVSRSGEPCG